MKIAMLGAKAIPAIGGIAHYIEELGARLVERGHEVTVYCRPHFLENGAEPYRGMRRVVTGGLRGKHLDATTHTLTSVLHARKEDVDIVHFHGVGPGALTPFAGSRHKARTVVTVHGLDWQRSKWGRTASRAMLVGARLGAKHADAVTVVSQCVGEEYRTLVKREATFIPTGVTLPALVPAEELASLGLTPDEFVFCAARLVPEKGLHYLIEAFRGLETAKKLVIAGDCSYGDPYVDRLRSQADERVVFAGFVRGRLLAELYSNAYLYVQPSEIEGLSISVLEALSYGRHVLASDIAENREALGPCGSTFRSKDVADLQAQLAELLGASQLVSQQCEGTRAFIQRQRNWDITTDHFVRLYADLMNQ